jgi:hypothetical protein
VREQQSAQRQLRVLARIRAMPEMKIGHALVRLVRDYLADAGLHLMGHATEGQPQAVRRRATVSASAEVPGHGAGSIAV